MKMDEKKDEFEGQFKPFKPLVVPGKLPEGMPLKCHIRVAIMSSDNHIAPGTDTSATYYLVYDGGAPMSVHEFFKRNGEFEKGIGYICKLMRQRGAEFDQGSLDHIAEWPKL